MDVPLLAWLGAAVNLGLVAFLGLVVRWFWNRRRWRRFETSIRAWAQLEQIAVDDLTEEEWKSLVIIKLVDTGHSPTEVLPLLDAAVLVAKALTSHELTGREGRFIVAEQKKSTKESSDA